jgi:hypothetical protein
MKDHELVRNAYRLILGREPENEIVLDREFEDIYALRDQFINSDEFKVNFNSCSKISVKKNVISNFKDLDNFVELYKNSKKI